jgi:formylglycine-generating enzyme
MFSKALIIGFLAAAMLLTGSGLIQANVFDMGTGLTSLQFVDVGNAGNSADNTGYGAVSYNYQIGKYEVTAGQYCVFLNAVAKTDPYALWITDMGDVQTHGGCNIQRSGSSGNYIYSVGSDPANRPVNWVNIGDALRFANWLTNGQPTTGQENLTTTEDGSYYLNGTTSYSNVTRTDKAKYVLPNDNEWYKAAYHKNDGVTADYWDYPTSTDATPSNVLSNPNPDPGNNANFSYNSNLTIGGPTYRTTVGDFEHSVSPYGTFDQGGNVLEWIDPAVRSASLMRGGAYGLDMTYLSSSGSRYIIGSAASSYFGIRIAVVPEPSSILLLITSAIASLIWWQRRTA